ncbi:serine hydrolase domain-containing protein [Ulvibacterium sp.]|uniref:serine hydrolase domain-containing protein n=1 Tax=Ulvibacterium sp. TaxID=2665914 RepID=UPI003BA9533C
MKIIYSKFLKTFGLTVSFLLITTGYAQKDYKYESLDTIIQSFMSERNILGFATCIVKDNTLTWSKSYGLADIGLNTPMSIDGIMNIGSISKTFTTVAAMQLWERGLLDLDRDINEYLDFKIRNPKYSDRPITIFQILTHTSSIQDGPAYHHSYSCGDPTISLYDWIYANLNSNGKYYNDGSNFTKLSPGDNKRYSNIAFGLLGLIIENVSKKPFNEYCQKHIFKPLGMDNTGWFLSEVDSSKHIKPYAYITDHNKNELLENKRLYTKDSKFEVNSFVENCLYSFPNYPDGLVRTSVRELSNYMIAIMNGGEYNGKRILKKDTIDKMLSLQLKGNTSQGLCWHTYEFDSTSIHHTLWGHTGGDPGITTYLFFNKADNTGIITFQNTATSGGFDIIKEIYLTSK